MLYDPCDIYHTACSHCGQCRNRCVHPDHNDEPCVKCGCCDPDF